MIIKLNSVNLFSIDGREELSRTESDYIIKKAISRSLFLRIKILSVTHTYFSKENLFWKVGKYAKAHLKIEIHPFD